MNGIHSIHHVHYVALTIQTPLSSMGWMQSSVHNNFQLSTIHTSHDSYPLSPVRLPLTACVGPTLKCRPVKASIQK